MGLEKRNAHPPPQETLQRWEGRVPACVLCVSEGVALTPADTSTHDEATSPHAVQGAHARSTATPSYTTYPGHPRVRLPWGVGAREPSCPSRPRPSPFNSSSDWSLLPHYANHLRRLGGQLPDVTKHGGWGSGLGSGRARAGAQGAPRGDLKPDPSVPPPRPGPAPPPAPPLSSPSHPLYAFLCSPPPSPSGPRPLPLALATGPGRGRRDRRDRRDRRGGRTGGGYGRGARRVCAVRRPQPAPGFQHRG